MILNIEGIQARSKTIDDKNNKDLNEYKDFLFDSLDKLSKIRDRAINVMDTYDYIKHKTNINVPKIVGYARVYMLIEYDYKNSYYSRFKCFDEFLGDTYYIYYYPKENKIKISINVNGVNSNNCFDVFIANNHFSDYKNVIEGDDNTIMLFCRTSKRINFIKDFVNNFENRIKEFEDIINTI